MKLRTVLGVASDLRTALAINDAPIPPRLMYAQLGALRFELVGPIVGFEGERTYTYAHHQIIEGKPRLQAIGDELEVITLTLEFKRDFMDPVIAYAQLCAAAAAHTALPLLFANGQVFGRFVITRISDLVDKTDELGAVTKRRTKVELTEFVESKPLEVQSRARRAAATSATAKAPKVAEKKPTVHADAHAVPLNVVIRGR